MTRTAWPLLLLLAAGCASQAPVTTDAPSTRQQTIDSLRAANETLEQQITTLEDSLQFYNDIFTGQYYRDRRRLLDRIDQLRYHAAVLRDGGTTVSTLQVEDLFEPASATLTETGHQQVASLAEVLQRQFPERSFRIEGHSDNVPVGPSLQEQYPSNWELSASRAAAVLRRLIEAHGMDPGRFAVIGYGPTRPTASNDTASGRRQNRRVRVAVLPEE